MSWNDSDSNAVYRVGSTVVFNRHGVHMQDITPTNIDTGIILGMDSTKVCIGTPDGKAHFYAPSQLIGHSEFEIIDGLIEKWYRHLLFYKRLSFAYDSMNCSIFTPEIKMIVHLEEIS